MNRAIIEEDLHAILAAPLPWRYFAGKTVLITGAAGCLPAYMVETLLHWNQLSSDRPVKIIALVRDRERALRRFGHLHTSPNLTLTCQDVCAPLDYCDQLDVIIHAASQASPKFFSRDPVGTLGPNTIGTAHLLELARVRDCQNFLFFSSSEVYGQVSETEIPTPEDKMGFLDPCKVRSCYAESKRIGETMCVAWTHQYGVPTRIVRPFHTYGPGMSLADGRIFADFVAAIVMRKDLVINSDGSARRAFCYLADAVAGFFTVLLKGDVGIPYNIGNEGAECSILELAKRLVSMYPQRGLSVVCGARPAPDYLPSSVSRNCPDTRRVRSLGWEPKTGIEKGFDRTVRSFE